MRWLRKRRALRNHWCPRCGQDLDEIPADHRWTLANPRSGYWALCSIECVARWSAVEAGVFLR